MLGVVKFIVGVSLFERAEDAGGGPLYDALRSVDWQMCDRAHDGDGYTAVVVEREARTLRAALAGLEGWTDVDITADYVLGRTRNERRYDGFGTRELAAADEDGWRTVAVRAEHLEWQTLRYDAWEQLPGGNDAAAGGELLATYDEAWERLKNGSAVAAELGLTSDERHAIAHSRLPGAIGVARARRIAAKAQHGPGTSV